MRAIAVTAAAIVAMGSIWLVIQPMVAAPHEDWYELHVLGGTLALPQWLPTLAMAGAIIVAAVAIVGTIWRRAVLAVALVLLALAAFGFVVMDTHLNDVPLVQISL